MKRTLVGIAIMTALAAPVAAQDKSEGRRLAELSFESVDRLGKGYLHQGDTEAARLDIFASIDTDESNSMELPEFLAWDYGFQQVAESADRELAYRTALKVVFSFWDRNGDGKISQTEHRKAVIADFNRADVNDNAILEKSEFLSGFSVLVAIRAALKPE